MRTLVIGTSGQLGTELCRALSADGLVVTAGRGSDDQVFLDLTRPVDMRATLEALSVDRIINAAAYTAVDAAEDDVATAKSVNTDAVDVLARFCGVRHIPFIHYSTDYVFDGQRAHAYVETDDTNPLSVYGRTKLEGDEAITNIAGPHLILRTGWIYESRGKNFVSTMLRLASSESPIRVVNDQWGTPNRARELAKLTQKLLHQATANGPAWWETHTGLYHVCAPDHTTWFNFAKDIIAKGHSKERAANVKPIPTCEFPTPARRPAWSVMSAMKLKATFGLELPGWRAQLNTMLAESQKGSSCS